MERLGMTWITKRVGVSPFEAAVSLIDWINSDKVCFPDSFELPVSCGLFKNSPQK